MTVFHYGVTLVIPAYNSEHTICKAIDSVLSQSTLPNEIIIVDDGSVDNTVERVKANFSQDFITIIQQENQGPAAARNRGVRAAKFAWIAFLDADDLWVDESKLSDQLAMAKQTDVALVDTFTEVYFSDGSVRNRRFIKTKNGPINFIRCNTVNGTSSVLANTELILAAGGFDESIKFGEDRLLWAELAKRGTIATVQKIQTRKINGGNNLTANASKYFSHNIRAIKMVFDLCDLEPNSRSSMWFINIKPYLKAALRNHLFCRELLAFAALHCRRKDYFCFIIPVYILSKLYSLLTSKDGKA